MNDDWMRELARVSREEEAEGLSRLDERWDRLSAGELSPEEEAELRALAESSKEGREAYEAFRPLGPEFEARVVQKIQSQSQAEAEAPEAARKEQDQGKLFPFPRRARFAAWGTAAAAAAAILMLSISKPAPLPDYVSPEPPSGGESKTRGSERIFAPGTPVTVTLRPETTGTYEKRLEAQAFLACGGELFPVKVKSRFATSGSVEINGTIPNVPPGNCTLWAVVCRQGKRLKPSDLQTLSTKAPVRQGNCVAVPGPKEIPIKRRSP
jgi:hypothetical protein